ncbi:uncharacterized protein BJX67DRAFT_84626 [Aspergillus lucknowensis]|uniref:Uncharacterized protein n=1 Tax=Aspergillus lucknowensis TaxID=176173 RepID=A0ABR4LS51_9EURO
MDALRRGGMIQGGSEPTKQEQHYQSASPPEAKTRVPKSSPSLLKSNVPRSRDNRHFPEHHLNNEIERSFDFRLLPRWTDIITHGLREIIPSRVSAAGIHLGGRDSLHTIRIQEYPN